MCSDGAPRLTFGRSLERNARFGDFDMRLLEEVSYETRVLETWRVNVGRSLVRNAHFVDLTRDFWRKSCAKRLFWRT